MALMSLKHEATIDNIQALIVMTVLRQQFRLIGKWTDQIVCITASFKEDL